MFDKITITPIIVAPKNTLHEEVMSNSKQPSKQNADYLESKVLVVIDYDNGEQSAFEFPLVIARLIHKIFKYFNMNQPYPYKPEQYDALKEAAEFINNPYLDLPFSLCINTYVRMFCKLPAGDTENDYDIFMIEEWNRFENRWIEKPQLYPRCHKLEQMIAAENPNDH